MRRVNDVVESHPREVQRSFLLGVVNGTLFHFAEALIDPSLVLTWFVSQLTPSNLLIGLVAPLGDAGWFLPQVFISARIQHLPRKMPGYVASAVVRGVAWLLLAGTVWFVDDPRILLAGFFVLYLLARLTSGLGGLAFFDVVAKTIPARRRGSYFAWRQLLGGLLGLNAAWILKVVLNHPALPFPRGHALLFALYCIIIALGMMAFSLVREPPGVVASGPATVGEQLRRAGRLWRTDRVYRRYMLIRIALALSGMAIPFYAVYAKNVLGAPAGMVGLYLGVRLASYLASNLPWGRLSDRRGNRLVLRLLLLGIGGTALLALALVGAVALFRPHGAWLPYLVLPFFFLIGAMAPAQELVGSNFLLELVPEGERALYLGFSNTLMGIVTILSGLGGLVVDALGFSGLFAVTLGLCVGGYALTRGLPEPREAR